MPRGGKRNGRPGKAYPNRTDLNQGIKTAPGQAYGAQARQAEGQAAIPLPQSPAPQAMPFTPPQPGGFAAPTQNPGEPVTAGLPLGAGPGPEILNQPNPNSDSLAQLKAIYSTLNPMADGAEQLRQIIERLEPSAGF